MIRIRPEQKSALDQNAALLSRKRVLTSLKQSSMATSKTDAEIQQAVAIAQERASLWGCTSENSLRDLALLALLGGPAVLGKREVEALVRHPSLTPDIAVELLVDRVTQTLKAG